MSGKKKPTLSSALHQFDTRSKQDEVPQEKMVDVEESHSNIILPSSLPPSRQGKKALTGYFLPEVTKQMKLLAVTEDVTIQALLTEAINDLFKKHGKPNIA